MPTACSLNRKCCREVALTIVRHFAFAKLSGNRAAAVAAPDEEYQLETFLLYVMFDQASEGTATVI